MNRLYIALAVIALIFSGCGNTNTSNKPVSTDAPVVEMPAPKQWSTSDLDPTKNGNFQYAIELVHKEKDSVAFVDKAIYANPADVMRRPWDYYGQIVQFSGTIAVVQDYPADNALSTDLGGESCEIVMTADDGTIVDGILRGNTKGLYEGDYVSFCGYPCGVMEVANKIGGKFHHLMVVGIK